MAERLGFGLYVHWPFCQAKCPYCDFNSHVTASVDHGRWRDALANEINRIAEETGARVLDSIFFGGGTPSLMPPETVALVIDSARAAWTPSNDMEITLEANPTSVEAGRFRGYRDAGVNRISIGIQALNDADLKALGRLHSVAEARSAFDIAQRTFARTSFDLIYARQNQSLSAWRRELTEALSMAADHLSLYQLTIEPGTAFGDRHARGGLRGLPHDDCAADMFALTQELTGSAGLPAYEVSNHAVPGAESRHNLIYWRNGEWAGVGPGAHGRLELAGGRTATEMHRSPDKWLKSVEDTDTGEVSRSVLSRKEQMEESILMGLRLTEGVSVETIASFGNADYDNKISYLENLGMIEIVGDHLRTTDKGRPLLNAILRELLA